MVCGIGLTEVLIAHTFSGGMDAYVRQHGKSLHHDEFYTDEKIISLFKNYTTNVVSRYVNSPAVFGWELANDPRSVFLIKC